MISKKPIFNPDGSVKQTFNPNDYIDPSKALNIDLSDYANKFQENVFLANNTFNNITAVGTVTSTNITTLTNTVATHSTNITTLNTNVATNNTKISALEAVSTVPSGGTLSVSTTYTDFTNIPRNILLNSTNGTFTVIFPVPTSSQDGYIYRLRNSYFGVGNPGAIVTLETTNGSSNRFRTTGVSNVPSIVVQQDKVCEIFVINNLYYCNFY